MAPHTALTDQLARTDQLFLRLNLLVLLVVVFLPFPTGLVADALHNSGDERVYVTLYGLTLLAIRLLGFTLDAYARHEHLYSPAGEGEELQSTQRKFLPVVIGYVIAILIGLALPVAGGGALFRYRGIPGGAVPGGRTGAGPAAQHSPMNAAPAPDQGPAARPGDQSGSPAPR